MAWPTDPITGALQSVDDAGTAIGKVRGGELVIDPNVQMEKAIGGQSSAQGAVIGINLGVDLLEPVLTYITGMPRSTAATQSTAYDLEVGTTGGEYALTRVQPAGFEYSFDAMGGGWPRVRLNYMAGKASEETTGSTMASPSGLTDCSTDFAVTLDGTDYLFGECTIRLNTNAFPFRSAGSKTTNEKRFPDAIMLGTDDWSCSVATAQKIPASVIDYLLDDIDSGLELIATGQGIVFTLSNLCSGRMTMPFVGENNVVWYRYEFENLPGYGNAQVGAV